MMTKEPDKLALPQDTSDADLLMKAVVESADRIRHSLTDFLEGGTLSSDETRAQLRAEFDRLDSHLSDLDALADSRQSAVGGRVTSVMCGRVATLSSDAAALMSRLSSFDRVRHYSGIIDPKILSMKRLVFSMQNQIWELNRSMDVDEDSARFESDRQAILN